MPTLHLSSVRDVALVVTGSAIVAAAFTLIRDELESRPKSAPWSRPSGLPVEEEYPCPHGWLLGVGEPYPRGRPATAAEEVAGNRSIIEGFHGIIQAVPGGEVFVPSDPGYPASFGMTLRWTA